MWTSANVLGFSDSESSTNWHHGNKHLSGKHTEYNRAKNATFLHANLNFSKAMPLKSLALVYLFMITKNHSDSLIYHVALVIRLSIV